MDNYRFMRMILMFDLPVVKPTQRREYRKFVKYLKKQGFIMFQESIYVKLSINESAVKNVKDALQKNIPPEGNVSLLTITERQFANIDFLLGEFKTDIINTDSRVIEL